VEGTTVVEVPVGERTALERILDESFEGWYLRHAKGTLRDVEMVRAAMLAGEPVALVMLKKLKEGVGYVYYIAVSRGHRRKGIGRLLLDNALRYFEDSGVKEVFAGVEEDNAPSEKLFESEGFKHTNLGEVSRKHGTLHALNMYRMMVVVPGEILLHRELSSTITP